MYRYLPRPVWGALTLVVVLAGAWVLAASQHEQNELRDRLTQVERANRSYDLAVQARVDTILDRDSMAAPVVLVEGDVDDDDLTHLADRLRTLADADSLWFTAVSAELRDLEDTDPYRVLPELRASLDGVLEDTTGPLRAGLDAAATRSERTILVTAAALVVLVGLEAFRPSTPRTRPRPARAASSA